MEDKTNPELDTTRFVNVDDEPFDIYINKKLARHLEPKEEQIIVLYVAQVGAKHLVDKVLQKQGIKDSLRDTPLRKDLFARILPDIAEKIEVKPLSEADRQKEFSKQLKVQENMFTERFSKQDETIEALKKELAEIKAKQTEPKISKPKVAKE